MHVNFSVTSQTSHTFSSLCAASINFLRIKGPKFIVRANNTIKDKLKLNYLFNLQYAII